LIGLPVIIGLLESPLVALSLYTGNIPLCTLDIVEDRIFPLDLEGIVLSEKSELDAAEVNRVAVADIAAMDSEIGEWDGAAALDVEDMMRF
jgi:hypothetical protein